ncbi:MAG: DNA polymerase III subunit gamma/tau [Planctomycetales bacterium]
MQEASASPHYTVLARRFRPQTFADVIGQQHVAQSLRNAIRTNRVAHAYLFTGARGVGKTSTARIFAKALNCPQAVDGVPCNECDICRAVSAGHDMDVLEIDGASNRGIDDIRSLRANVNVKSMRTKHKLYIIDEVHMLTKEAFNALLKTLEEPPPNVKFVFCTTEPGKVPDTILSRCQRFDFSTIQTDNIAGRLREIAAQEGYEVAPDALELVARRAAGSMRDSQSLFDQLLAFGQSPITVEDVHRLLGTAPDERLIELFAAVVDRRSDTVLAAFDRALADGVQLGELMDQSLHYVRDLMVIAAGAERLPLASVSESSRAPLAEQAGRWGLETILAGMEILAEAKLRMARVPYGRAIAELALVRLSRLEDLADLESLIEQMRSGNGVAAATAPGSRGSAAPSTVSPARPSPPPQSAVAGGNASAVVSDPDASERPGGLPRAAELPEKKTAEQAPPGLAGDARPVQPAVQVDFRPGVEAKLWSYLLSRFQDMARDHLKMVESLAISGPNHLDLSFRAGYHFSKQYCDHHGIFDRLQQIIREVTGREVRISSQVNAPAPETPAEPAPRVPEDDPEEAAAGDPYVQQVKAVFGGRIVKIETNLAPANRKE